MGLLLVMFVIFGMYTILKNGCVCVCVCWVNKWGMSCDSKCWVPVGLGFSVCLYDARCGPKKRCPIPIFF